MEMSMPKKYYVVRKGRTPGIYHTWNDCKAQVDGFSGAEYKSFANIEDAKAFLDNSCEKKINVQENEGVPVTDELHAVAYVDGSYNQTTKEFSYGVVMFHNGEELHFSQRVDDETLVEMRNVAGEIKGSECAMRYAVEHKCKTLVIYHDYEGISKWCTGAWKTNKEGTRAYKEYFQSIENSIDIEFRKVKGHSGDTYNEIADKLAKQAIFPG